MIDVAIPLTALRSQLESLVAPVFLLYVRLLSAWGRKYSNACLSWSVHGPPHHFCPRFQQKSQLAKSLTLGGAFYPVRDPINPRRVLAYSFTFLKRRIRPRFPTRTFPILFAIRNIHIFIMSLGFLVFADKAMLHCFSFELRCRYRFVGLGRKRFLRFARHAHRCPLQLPVHIAHTHGPCLPPKNDI